MIHATGIRLQSLLSACFAFCCTFLLAGIGSSGENSGNTSPSPSRPRTTKLGRNWTVQDHYKLDLVTLTVTVN